MQRIRILIVDDHPLFREGVAETLARDERIEITPMGATAEEAERLIREHRPDVLLLDVGIPGGGLTAVERVVKIYPKTKIIMLTASEKSVMPALKAGACGYVLKGVSGRELLTIIHGAMAGETYVTPTLAAGLLGEMSRIGTPTANSPQRLDALNERERQILEHVARGYSNREIGDTLGLSEKTVKHYMTNVLQKLRVKNRVEAALIAQKETQGGSVPQAEKHRIQDAR